MRPIWFALRRRAGLVFSATVVITGALAAPAFAISVAQHWAGGRGAGSTASSSSDLIWTGVVLLALVLVAGVVVFCDVIRDRATGTPTSGVVAADPGITATSSPSPAR